MWFKPLFVWLLLFGLSAPKLNAQTISIKSIDNNTAKQLTVNAEVKIPQGWQIITVTMIAPPAGGVAGQGGRKRASDTGGGVWAGTITKLTTDNEYDVQAQLEVIDAMSTIRFYYSAKQEATVK